MIKTFRGQLADGGQDRIRLSTIKGKVGYKIIKFSLLDAAPSAITIASTVQIWTQEQSSVVSTINFTDSSLLAAGIYHAGSGTASPRSVFMETIFDNMTVNQDIYVTHADVHTGAVMNYYIELEVIPLDDAGAEYTTLKDIRQKGTP